MSPRPLVPTLASYQLRLPAFEGPLDVLLTLIERERLDISELSLVAVTDGFLAYIDNLRDPEPAMLAEFAGIAARLLVLKSRSLLPQPATVEQEPTVDDLAAQLLEYQRVRQAAAALREKELAGWRAYARPPMTMASPPKVVLQAPPLMHLRRALLRTLARMKEEPEVAALTRIVSIADMLQRLRSRLMGARRASFQELVGTEARDETIAGFIALLALWRRGEVAVTQQRLFGVIHVEPIAVHAEGVVQGVDDDGED
jgi:segregation and condensation protein A